MSFFDTGSTDGGGVHLNSTLFSHAFYLAVEGGRNATSNLSVTGVGAANRAQIEKVFFRAETQLMPNNANLPMAAAAVVQAAIDLYGGVARRHKRSPRRWLPSVSANHRSRDSARMLHFMRRSNRQLFLPAVLIMAIAGTRPAAAQAPSDARVEISANVGMQTGASTFTASNTLASNGGETETITVDHGGKTALGFSVGAAVRLLPRVWVGAQYRDGREEAKRRR